MAIDSAAKRHSIARFGRVVTLPGLPIPDGTISAADRAGLLWLYTGITLASAASSPDIITFTAGGVRTATLTAGGVRTHARTAGGTITKALTAEN